MAHRAQTGHDPTIGDEEALALALGIASEHLDDWIQDQVELADWVGEGCDDAHFYRVLTRSPPASTYSIQLAYPFALDDFHEQVGRAEYHFRGAIHAASVYDEDAEWGTDRNPGELCLAVAAYLDAEAADVRNVLRGQWQCLEIEQEAGSNGEDIHCWLVPTTDDMVAVGLGADEIYVVPLLHDEDNGYHVEEWPIPTVTSWWAREWQDVLPQGNVEDVLQDIATEIDTVLNTAQAGAAAAGDAAPATKRLVSADHDVRLSTKNLRVAGIDLDFEVARGGTRLGTLSVSEGGLLWRPARTHRRKGRAKAGISVSWKEFAEWAES